MAFDIELRSVTGFNLSLSSSNPPVYLEGILESNSSISGGLTVERKLSGTINSISYLSSDLIIPKQLSGTINSESFLYADFIIPRSLAGTIVSQSSLSGNLLVEGKMSGTISAYSSISGSLTLSKFLSGTLQSNSTISTNLIVPRLLTGAIDSTSSVSSTLIVPRELSGALNSDSVISANLVIQKALVGELVSESNIAGNLVTPKLLSGSLITSSSVSGLIKVERHLLGWLSPRSNMLGNLIISQGLSGVISGTSNSLADLTVFIKEDPMKDIQTSFQSRLSSKVNRLSQKLHDNGIRLTGTISDCIKITTNKSDQGDILKRRVDKLDVIPIVFPPLVDVPLRKVVPATGQSFIIPYTFDIQPIEIMVPLSAKIDQDDLIIKFYENTEGVDPYISILEVKDILGTFGARSIIYQKYKATFFDGELPPQIIAWIMLMAQRRQLLQW